VRGWGAAFAVAISGWLIALSGSAGADAFDSIGSALKRLDLFQGLQITGRGDFSVRGDFTSGSREAYESQFWNTGMMQATTSFDISGPIWRGFGVQAHIANSGYGYNDNRLMLGWQDNNTAVLWGDLNVRLAGNEFASYTKSLKGVQIDQLIGHNVLLRAFQSREKGLVRRQTFPGNNTSGPYFLTYTPIVEGTELVKVDEQPMRFGADYTLDYDTGQLYFEPPGQPPRLIPSTSVIAVSYQSASTYEGGGETRGAQVESTLLGDRLQIVLTRLEHNTGGGRGDTARFQDDIFAGSGSTGPFDVRYSPILADGAKATVNGQQTIIRDALIVLVDNVEQREGVDFYALRQIGRIIFNRIVPPESTVRIKYYYEIGPGESAFGDSAITGLALTHQLSKSFSWDLTFAQSDAAGNSSAGSALSTGARFNMGSKFDANVQYRSIDPNFRYIDTVGFFRNEKGLNAAVGWRPNQNIQFAHTFSDVKTDSGYSYGYSGYYGGTGYGDYGDGVAQTDDTTPTSLDIRAVRHDSNLSVTFPGWPSLRLSRQSMTNSGGSGGDSLYETLNAGLDYSPQKMPMTFHAGWVNTKQDYSGTGTGSDSDPYSSAQSSDTQSISLAASWTPSERLGFATNWNSNTSRSAYKSQRGDSNSFQVSARYQPMQNLSLNLDWSQTSSLGAVTSGFYGGGIGYGGYSSGGWGGGIGGYPYGATVADTVGAAALGLDRASADDDTELSRYNDSSARLGLSWQPASSLSFDANLGLRKYTSGGSVGYLADSNQRYANVSASWLPNQDLAFNVSVGSDLLQFLDQGRGGVLNNSLTFSGTYRPQKSPWTYGLSVNRQWGVSPNYTGYGESDVADLVDTSLMDVTTNIEYRLAERARIVGRFGFSDFSGGFSDFAKNTADIGLQYQLSDSVGLNLGWQFIKNDSRLPQSGGDTSPSYSGGDYTTNLLVFSLSTNFQSTVSGQRDQGVGLNQPITPGYGMFQSYGGGYGGGFMGGLDLPRKSGSSSGLFSPGYSSPLAGAGFSNPYGSFGYFGQSSGGLSGGSSYYGGGSSYYGGGSSSYYGGGSSYFGGGGSNFGAGSSYYGGGSSYYCGGSSYYGGGSSYYGGGGLSAGLGDEFPGYGGAGSAYSPYEPYGEGSEGGGGYGGYGGGYGGGSPWGGGGRPPFGGPGAGPRPQLPQPAIGDPWAQGGTEFPIDDMRDV
jgi:hypothetical protein